MSEDEGPALRITKIGEDYHAAFAAMATPCEIRVQTADGALAERLGQLAQQEALRVEHKFSRYRSDSVVGRINASGKGGLLVDAETGDLLDFAQECHKTSDGLFDITSGVLRRAWHFDGSDRLPDPNRITSLMPLVGWRKVSWKRPHLRLLPGMEIDFGGLAKEYAVDLTLHRLMAVTTQPLLVNFGGDLRVSGPRSGGTPWHVAIESVQMPGTASGILQLSSGALATSGDARRFLLHDGIRYGHILDPRTGWSVKNPPSSVTVAAETCVEAGLTATLAMLQGADTEEFLKREIIRAWVIR